METALQMMRSGQEDFTSKDLWLCLPRSEVSEKKKDTALYRLSKGSKTYEEAINNQFAHDNFENIKKENINEYTPLCGFEDIYVYRHKSSGRILISQKPHGKRLFGGNDEKLLFMRSYGLALTQHKARNNIIYESYSARRAFEDLLS